MQITECLADIQRWREDRKKMQKEYEEAEKKGHEDDQKEKSNRERRFKIYENKMKQEQERIEKVQKDLIKNAIARITKITDNSSLKETKMKSQVFKEMLDHNLLKEKYDELEKHNVVSLQDELKQLKEYENRYDHSHISDLLKADEKYMINESIKPISEDSHSVAATDAPVSSSQSLVEGIETQLDDIDKIFSELNISSAPATEDEEANSNPQDEY